MPDTLGVRGDRIWMGVGMVAGVTLQIQLPSSLDFNVHGLEPVKEL